MNDLLLNNEAYLQKGETEIGDRTKELEGTRVETQNQ